jgi:hypothetical protein
MERTMPIRFYTPTAAATLRGVTKRPGDVGSVPGPGTRLKGAPNMSKPITSVTEFVCAAHAPREPRRLQRDGEIVSYILETGRDGWEYVVARVIRGVPTYIAGGERKSYKAASRALSKARARVAGEGT